MAIGYFLRVGDKTTCGGQILTGDNTFIFHGRSAARQGDLVTCGKHSGTYNILGGVSNVWGNGRMMAGTLDSFSSCPCKARLINSITDCYSKEDEPMSRAYNPVAPETPTQQPISQPSNHYAPPIIANDSNKIRIDAQHLIDCADELCEKHLYFAETKESFKSDIKSVADQIVHEVESGQKSYEQGAAELKQEESDLFEQSKYWILNGLSILGGAAQIWAGGALCATGGGCIIGAVLIAHGSNNIYEGAMGIYEGNTDAKGPLREGYIAAATGLGFDKSMGVLAYDMADFGLSLHGKLKLLPKLNAFGEIEKPLYLNKHARQDTERAYKQMRDYLLTFELGLDAVAIYKLKDDIKNAFFLDKKSGEVMMFVKEPEKVTNVKHIITDDCRLIIGIESQTGGSVYYECPNPADSSKVINVSGDGDILE
ncbi:DUF4225 domain-containing protein [Providencia rettgeri]